MREHSQAFIERKFHDLETLCRKNGLSLTVQRRAILENLAGRKDHPTADQIYLDIKDRLQGVSRTTVYRVLEAFVQLGIAQKICNPDAKARFDADVSRHHHAICLQCETVVDVYDDQLNHLCLSTGGRDDFEIVDYSVSFVGHCAVCRDASQGVSGATIPKKELHA